MSDQDKEKQFTILKVKLLFERMKEGRVKFVAENMPHTIEALEAVRFDADGNPDTKPLRDLSEPQPTLFIHGN